MPPQNGHSILDRERSASGHAKRVSVPVFSFLSHVLTKLENIGFPHRTLVGKRHCRGMQLQSVRATPKQGMYLQAQLQPHVIHKQLRAPLFLFRPTSVLVRFVCFLLSHSAAFTARSWWWNSSSPVSCTDHIQIKRAKKKGRNAKKNLSQVFLGLVHEFVSIIKFSPDINVVIRRAAFSSNCPYVFAPKSPLRLAREKDTLLGSPPTFC